MSDYAKLFGGVWEKIDRGLAQLDPGYGFYRGDDFIVLPDTTFVYGLAADGGGSQALATDEVCGVYVCTSDGDDTDEVTFTDAPVGGYGKIVVNSGNPVAWEARVKVVEVADLSFFVGLTEEALGADLTNDADGVMPNKDYLGFHILCASPTEIDAVYRLLGATAVKAGDNVATSDAGFHRYGMNFDGADLLKWYVDGVEVARATIAAATFPNDEPLGFTITIKTGEDVAKTFEIDNYEFAGRLNRYASD